jgi:fructokinase
MINKQVRVFGEVLFDQFSDGQRVLGGAPFNVAWHLQAFGQAPDFISRIGNDTEGFLIKQAMLNWGMSIENLQIDPTYATGKVQVAVVNGEPHYDILANQAYDFISATQVKGYRHTPHVLYHGTLASRHPLSAATLDKLVIEHSGKIFVDVNLRTPWWQPERVKQLLDRADWAKLNDDELMQLQPVQGSLRNTMRLFRKNHDLDVLIVTCGERGAVAVNKQGEFFEVVPADTVSVVDTVGAGDAFSAVLLLGLQHDWPLPLTLQRAQAFASALVGQQGATVQDLSFYQAHIHAWQLD